MSTPLLRLENVSARFEDRQVIDNVSLSLYPHELTTIVGPNGSGKTTLLKIALGLLRPTMGTVTRAPLTRIGYMPQKLNLSRTLPMDVGSFLRLVAPKEKVHDTLHLVGAAGLSTRSLHVLSGGEMQRVLLASALLRDPDLLVLDEPLQGVDPKGQEALYGLLEELKKERKCAILLVSHDLYFVHKSSDFVLCLNGHVCCSGKPDAVREDPAYRALFGLALPQGLAPYTHNHDHAHDGPCQEKV
ncbi:MAG: metal ABC transporter ATP-binding protein [Proteobacteria bacterium]|nr:metal ABC transporter ATP-binding protein [Pseudomonadota bacterium]